MFIAYVCQQRNSKHGKPPSAIFASYQEARPRIIQGGDMAVEALSSFKNSDVFWSEWLIRDDDFGKWAKATYAADILVQKLKGIPHLEKLLSTIDTEVKNVKAMKRARK